MAQSIAVLRGTAGFRTTEIYAAILVGDFAARIKRIIHPLEKLGQKENIAFSGKVDYALKVLLQVRYRMKTFLLS